MAIEALSDPKAALPKTGPHTYTTPLSTRIGRYTLKIFECLRSLFHPLTHCLSNIDLQRSLEPRINIYRDYRFLNNPQKIAQVNAAEIELGKYANEQIIFIPINLKGFWRNHIVFFAVNTKSREIIFYDSNGWTLADYNLIPFYEKLHQRFSDYSLVQNTNKEQYDLFNCGIYVIHKILLLSSCFSAPFSSILRKYPLSFSAAMEKRASLTR